MPAERKSRYLAPRTLQLVGLLLMVGLAIFWAITGRESLLLVGAAGSFCLLGNYDRLRETLIDIAGSDGDSSNGDGGEPVKRKRPAREQPDRERETP